MKLTDPRILSTVALTAIGVWVGGMLALGAIAAPVVFGMVPAPESADAMTVVFRRFDAVAMSCAVIVVGTEAVRAVARPRAARIARIDLLRSLVAAVAGALAVVQGMAISPKIEGLHRAGAIRGLGSLGLELESTHRLAELNGKTQTVLAVALIALHAFSLASKPGT
jgi:hypothetical protein